MKIVAPVNFLPKVAVKLVKLIIYFGMATCHNLPVPLELKAGGVASLSVLRRQESPQHGAPSFERHACAGARAPWKLEKGEQPKHNQRRAKTRQGCSMMQQL